MKKLLFIFLFAATANFKGFAQTKIEAKDAAKHLNGNVTICDKIADGKYFSNSQTTLLNVGAPHPNELLTLVIKGDDRKKFSEDPEKLFKNKKVCITGKVIDFKGRPEIVITEASQITLDK
ncbi:hypothetical protein [Mucilaginibacter sp. KACC 22063]|uniref:hypothetical protein n=1 Tax=Mucilaginibacter sp. KACC 22063 TaxID=3025666 RepID=UPI0023654635|nr:hypothetical protein [Mucilaginibacter sp. KACC 22063]WDF56747.1 hypothetical protein PQ461_06735 [Mucilaginibacter sp. KACC 22063]